MAAVKEAAERAQGRRQDGPFRLPIDRVFTLKGFGTVVTGTAVQGELKAGDEVEPFPEPEAPSDEDWDLVVQ